MNLKNVAFSYLPEQKLIEDLNLEVEPGQTIAIVGPTGCGKTTLINLLMRFYDVNEGSVSPWKVTDIRHMTQSTASVTKLWYGAAGYLAAGRNHSG